MLLAGALGSRPKSYFLFHPPAICVRLVTVAVRAIAIAGAGSGVSEADAAEIAPAERSDDDDELALNIFTFTLGINHRFEFLCLRRNDLAKNQQTICTMVIRESDFSQQISGSELVCPICKIYHAINQFYLYLHPLQRRAVTPSRHSGTWMRQDATYLNLNLSLFESLSLARKLHNRKIKSEDRYNNTPNLRPNPITDRHRRRQFPWIGK